MFGTAGEHGRGTKAASRCAFHARMDQRGRVDVHCGTASGQVRLNGDDSAFIAAEGLDADAQANLLATLAVLRLAGLERHERHQRILASTRTGD